MEIGANTDTAVQGTTLGAALFALGKAFWRDWKAGRRTERLDNRFKSIDDRLRGHDEEIESHALYDARNYVSRDEITSLREHIDDKFDKLNAAIITVIRDSRKD